MSIKYEERSQPLLKICCIFSDLAVLALIFVPFCFVLHTLYYNTKQKEECYIQKSSQTGVASSLLNGICPISYFMAQLKYHPRTKFLTLHLMLHLFKRQF